jgi:hypothetical protein
MNRTLCPASKQHCLREFDLGKPCSAQFNYAAITKDGIKLIEAARSLKQPSSAAERVSGRPGFGLGLPG